MSRFTVLLFAVELARQIHAHYMETLETGSCQPWDMFHLACCRPDQARGYSVISGDVWYVFILLSPLARSLSVYRLRLKRSTRLPVPTVLSNVQLRSLLED